MIFKHDDSWNAFKAIFKSYLPVKEAWNRLISFHEQISPESYWTLLRQLDVEVEQMELVNWLHDSGDYIDLPSIERGSSHDTN